MKREELTEIEIEALECFLKKFYHNATIENYDLTDLTDDGFANLEELVTYVEEVLYQIDEPERGWDFPSVHDNPYYDENLDIDQQSIDFWNEF